MMVRGIIPTSAAAAADQQEDRISNLPDVVIHDILSRLPSSKQPAKLAMLSERWAHIWRSYPIIDFDSCEWTRTTGIKKKLKKFLAATRVKYSDMKHVTAVRITLRYSTWEPAFVDELLGFLGKVTTKEIRIKCIDYYCGPIIIPEGLFNEDSFRNLKVVELRNCALPKCCSSSFSFGIFLRILSLKRVRFPFSFERGLGDRILNNIIQAASSTLESLTLSDLDRIESLQLQDLPNLKTLDTTGLYCRDFEINGALPLDILHDICSHLMRSYGQRHCGAECKILHKQLRKLKVMKRVIMNNGGTEK
ncbi:F-box/LRR-repeat protein 25 [Linum perenne]